MARAIYSTVLVKPLAKFVVGTNMASRLLIKGQ